ncbi:filaggrin-like [Cydia fagiglandana]|uniref:filaggrin-like n=1 Tax=Cydia fagiglandana TaxID=1458189 RepID=UPI002FEE3FDC
MKAEVALLAVVFVAVGAFPTSPVLPPLIPLPRPRSTITHSSRTHAASCHFASAQSDKGYSSIGPDGTRVTSNEKLSSAEEKEGHQYTHGDHGISSDGHGGHSSWGLDGDHRSESEGKSAEIDKKIVVKDKRGTRVQKERGSSASDKSAYDVSHKRYKTVADGKGGYKSDTSHERQVGKSQGSSAASDKVLKIRKNDGTWVRSSETAKSAAKKDSHQYTHGDHGISSDSHGGHSSWGLEGDHRSKSEGKSAEFDKKIVVKDKRGTRVQKERGSSASDKSAYDVAHKRYKTVADGKGGYKSDTSHERKVGKSQGSSAASDKVLKITKNDGTWVRSSEAAKSAARKDSHQYTHGDHGISSDSHGGHSSWGLEGDHRSESEGKSAEFDKKSVVKDKRGTRVQKERGSSASDKSAYDVAHKRYKTVADGKGGYKSDTSHERKVGKSQGSSAASDKVLKITKNDGTWVRSSEAAKSAARKDSHQYTHGDHGISSDSHGGHSSWGLEGDHRSESEGKSAEFDKKSVVKDKRGTRVQKERGSSASDKSAYDVAHKRYKTVADGKGGYKSDTSHERHVGKSTGSSAASDKVLKITKNDGTWVRSSEAAKSAARKDSHQYTHGDHGISSDSHGGHSSWGLEGDHRSKSEGKSAEFDKKSVVKDKRGTRVQKERGSSASDKSAYDVAHKRYKTVADGKGGYKSDTSHERHVGKSTGSSAASDKVLKITKNDGTWVRSSEAAKSAARKDSHQYTHGDHGISSDSHGGHSSWGLEGDHRSKSEGKSAEFDKKSVVKDKRGTRVQKERGSSASDKSAYDVAHKRYKTVADGKGGYKSDTSHERKVGKSQGSSAASDKVLKITKNDGTWVRSSEAAKSAARKDSHQYTHGDHGISSDSHGGHSSWGLEGDHRSESEGKSAEFDKKSVVKDKRGTRVQKERGSSASDKSAYDVAHKRYKTVADGKGGYKSDTSHERKVGKSQGSSAASDKVLKITKNDGTWVRSSEAAKSAARKDSHQYTHGDHGISSDSHGGHSSWGLEGDHRSESEGKSAEFDKKSVVKDKRGARVQKERGSSASDKSAYDVAHKRYKTVADGKGGYKSDTSHERHVGKSTGSSAASDKVLKITKNDGTWVRSSEAAKSAARKDSHQYTHGDHGISSDSHGGHSSWGLEGDHRSKSEGKSAEFDKKIVVKDKRGRRVQKERGSSASDKSAYDVAHKRYKTVADGKGGYKSDTSHERQVGKSQGSSAASDKVLKIRKNDGTWVRSSETAKSAAKKDSHQYTHGDHGISSDSHGGHSSWGLEGDHRSKSEGKSAEFDKKIVVKDKRGTRVQKERGSSASDKSAYDVAHKRYKTVADGKGGYKSDTSHERKVGKSQGSSAASDKVLKITKNDGTWVRSSEAAKSAARKDSHQYTHGDHGISSDSHGGHSSWGLEGDHRSESEGKSAEFDKKSVVKDKRGTRVQKERGSSASDKSAYDVAHKRYKTVADGKGGYKSDTSHERKVGKSQGSSAASDKVLKITKNDGTWVRSSEAAKSAARKDSHQYTHGDHGISSDSHGGHSSWGLEGDHRSESEGKSAEFDKKSVVKDKRGTRVQKERGSSASDKSAYDVAHKRYKTVADGKGGYKSDTSHERHVGKSTGSSAASDKVLKITKNDGTWVRSSEAAKSAARKDSHQYTHGDHGISSDSHGGHSSWGLEGDHRSKSEGKSAEFDKKSVVKDKRGTRVQKERGSSASDKSAYDVAHKRYKTVADGKGGYKSDTSHERHVGKSTGSSAASDKVLKITKNDGTWVRSSEAAKSAARKDSHQYTHGDHGISSDSHGGHSSWGLEGDHRSKSEGKSAEFDKKSVVKDKRGTRVQKERGSSASDKSAYDVAHKRYKTVADGKGGYKSDTSHERKVGKSQGSSAASDKVLKITKNDGTWVRSSEAAKSAARKDSHQYTHGDHGISSDSHGGHSSWGLEGDHRSESEGKSAEFDKKSVVKDKRGTRVQKERGSSASDKSAYDVAHKRYKTVADGKGGYKSDTSHERKVGKSQGSSAASDKVLKITKNDGTWVRSSEAAKSAARKDSHQYTHGDHGISSDSHGGHSSWGLEGDHRSESEGKSAEFDKKSVVKDKRGARVQKERGSSASDKSAYDVAHKRYKTVADGKGGYKSDTSHERHVGKSTGSSAASDKVLKITKNDGTWVRSSEAAKSAARKDSHQYTHGDHGISSDSHGGHSSWGLEGDHRSKSEGKSAEFDKKIVVKDKRGRRVQKERGSSASDKSAYDVAHKRYKTVADGKGGYKSDTSHERKVGKSQGSSAASDKVLKITKNDGTWVRSSEAAKSAARKDSHQYTHGDHGISSDSHGGHSSWGLEGDHRSESEGKSAEIDKKSVVKDKRGTRVQKERGSSASDKSAYDVAHKRYKTVADGKGGYKSDTSHERHVGKTEGSSAASDMVLKITKNDGTWVRSSEAAKSAARKDSHQYTHGDHGISSDSHGGHSSWGLEGDHRSKSEGKSAEFDKKSVVKDKRGTRVQKERGSSASDKSAYDVAHKRYKTVADGKGGYKSDTSHERHVGKSTGSSAASDKVLKITKNDGTWVRSSEAAKSAARKDSHQYTHGDHGISSDSHGGHSSWGLEGDHRSKSEGKSAEFDKKIVVKDKRGTRVQKERGSSASDKSAYDVAHKRYKTVADGKGGYKSDTSHERKVGKSQVSSAASDKVLKITKNDGTWVRSSEAAKSAARKDSHQYTHGDHGISSDSHGGHSSWGLEGDHRSKSEGKSAEFDKKIVVKDKRGTRVQKERGSSASDKSAYDVAHKRYKTVADGKGGYKSDTSHERQVGKSQGSSAASDKVLKITKNDGTWVRSSEAAKSAARKDSHQYTHGDHGISSDGHGGHSSWGLEGDHRSESEGKSAEIDTKSVVKDKSGTRVQKEHGSSASDKSAYEDVHKGYKTVVDGKGGYESDRHVDKQVGNSQGVSAYIDKVVKIVNKHNSSIRAKEQAASASRDNSSEKSHSQQKTKLNADGYESSNTYSKDLASDRAASNSHKKEYQLVGNKRESVTISDEGAAASKETRNSGDYINQNTYSNKYGSGTYNSKGTHASIDKQASDSHDKKYKSVGRKGESVTTVDQRASASRENQYSGTHNDQGTSSGKDGSHNSWGSRGKNAGISKQASDSHNQEYQSVGENGESVKSVDTGERASTENRNSGNYNNNNKYDAPNGSGTSSNEGNYASADKQASDSHNREYQSVGKSGELVRSTDQRAGASKETRNSGDYVNQNTYSNKYGSGTYNSKGTHASVDKQASDSHDKKYKSVGRKGESVTTVDQRASASRENQYSGTHNDQGTSSGKDGSHNRWGSRGKNAGISKQASDSHNQEYQSVGENGESVKSLDRRARASTENRNSGNYNNNNKYDGPNGSGTSSNEGNYASADKQASDFHNREYQSVGKSGESVRSTDQRAGASKESGYSGTYIGQSAYKGPQGSGKSSSEGTNASADKQASNSHNKHYESIGKGGKSVLRTNDTGSAASKQSGNSGSYRNQMTNNNNDGSSSSSRSTGDYASASDAASKSRDQSYESIGKDGKYTYIRNTGDAASESSGSSSNNKNQGTSNNADGSSESWNIKDNAATAHKAASDSNKSVLIEKNPDGSSRLKTSETANASVDDGSSSDNQSSRTSVGADGSTTSVNSKSSNASKTSASSSSSETVEVINS